MNGVSIRLPDNVREQYDELAGRQGLKTSQLLRSLLIRLAREYDNSKVRPGVVTEFPAADETPLLDLLAAEPATPRRKD